MDTNHTYVDCDWCKNRQDGPFITNADCHRCSGTGQVIDPREILCNLCGESMCPLGTEFEQDPLGLINAQVTGGYFSDHLLDLNTYQFSLCEKCLRHIFMKCKIPPKIGEYNLLQEKPIWEDGMTFEQDQASYEYSQWKEAGGHHQAYLNRKCNIKKDCPNSAIYTYLFSDDFSEDCSCEEHKGAYAQTVDTVRVKFMISCQENCQPRACR